MSVGRAITLGLYAAVLGAFVAFGWVAGLVLVALATVRFARRVARFQRALAETTRCPSCSGEVPQYGAFSCAPCGARTLGWIWRCRWCGAWAGYTECPSCGMSVPNPAIRELDP